MCVDACSPHLSSSAYVTCSETPAKRDTRHALSLLSTGQNANDSAEMLPAVGMTTGSDQNESVLVAEVVVSEDGILGIEQHVEEIRERKKTYKEGPVDASRENAEKK